MPKLNLQRNYSVLPLNYQLSLPLDIEQRIPDDDPVRLLSLYVENMDLEALYQTYSRIRRYKRARQKNTCIPCRKRYKF